MCDQQSLRSACAYAQSDRRLCLSVEYSMTIRLLTKLRLEFLSLKGGCTGSSECTLVNMPHCWKSHVVAHIRLERGLLFKVAVLQPGWWGIQYPWRAFPEGERIFQLVLGLGC